MSLIFGDGPVHILPYDPQCHELFAIYYSPISLKVNCRSLMKKVHRIFFNVFIKKELTDKKNWYINKCNFM